MKTILILDDEPAVRQSIADFFEDYLWWPIQAGSAEEALELLAAEVPLAAVVDVRLPGMDGNTFIREVSRRGIKMAFVICTGSPEYDMPDDLLVLPFVSDRLFTKPVTDMADMEREILYLIELVEQME
ncbi:MAG: response regulator [Ardenticatenaceae bacterium]|nr:response regulator [Ardenticatenaceae bacterium]MCB8948942.1 response regulator [Ardenticatenaceae bacterium]